MNFSYLSPPERIEIIRALVTFLSKKDSLEIDLYFSEFGIENLNNDWIPLMEGTQKSLQSANDEILLNLYKFLIDGVNVSVDTFHTWKDGGVRLFMSHSALHKGFVSTVAEKLAHFGIECFVAHDDIRSGETWFEVMTGAIRSCDVFVAFIHEDFKSREWCDHELGFALGLKLQPLLLNFGHLPYGFLKQLQNLMVQNKSEDELCTIIFNWLAENPTYSKLLEDSLVRKFATSNNFVSTRELYWKISALSSLSSENFERVAAAFKENDQVYNYGGFHFIHGEWVELSPLRKKVITT